MLVTLEIPHAIFEEEDSRDRFIGEEVVVTEVFAPKPNRHRPKILFLFVRELELIGEAPRFGLGIALLEEKKIFIRKAIRCCHQ